jgi:hypothetical protein
MKLRLINDFLRHGEVLGVKPGTKQSDIEKILGKPSHKDRLDVGTAFWYGSIYILSSKTDRRVCYIELEPDRRHGLYKGCKSVGIATEGLPDLTPKEAKALVESHGIKTVVRQSRHSIPRPEGDKDLHNWLQVPSGALMEFERFSIDNPAARFSLVGLRVDPYCEGFLKPITEG